MKAWRAPDRCFGPDRPFDDRDGDWDSRIAEYETYERLVIDMESPDYHG